MNKSEKNPQRQSDQRSFLNLNVKLIGEMSISDLPCLILCPKSEIRNLMKELGIDVQGEIMPGCMISDSYSKKMIYIEIENKDSYLTIASTICNFLNNSSLDRMQCLIAKSGDIIIKIIEACLLKYHQIENYKTKEVKKQKEISFIVEEHASLEKEMNNIVQIVQQVLQVRKLVNLPPNYFRPSDMAAEAYKLEQLRINCKVLQGDDIKDMGCLTAVGQASSDRSKLIVLEWLPRPTDKRIIGFVGKGITFDSGGLSIKTPSKHMEDMKSDMAGGATVMGIIKAAAEMQLEYNLVGVIPCAENMISGSAMRPGDVLHSYSGQTVEVLNTDAEGRLILADALWYMQSKYSPQIMIDFATLTGAVVAALGHVHMGLFSNNDALARILLESGEETDELLWRLPLHPDYDISLNSKIADVQNISPSSTGAGSITAAQFLQRFVKTECMWAHIDFAGTAYTESPGRFHNYGASGEGVRLILKALPRLSSILID